MPQTSIRPVLELYKASGDVDDHGQAISSFWVLFILDSPKFSENPALWAILHLSHLQVAVSSNRTVPKVFLRVTFSDVPLFCHVLLKVMYTVYAIIGQEINYVKYSIKIIVPSL